MNLQKNYADKYTKKKKNSINKIFDMGKFGEL